jgi:uncharacterized phage protein (TIGR01671 family)
MPVGGVGIANRTFGRPILIGVNRAGAYHPAHLLKGNVMSREIKFRAWIVDYGHTPPKGKMYHDGKDFYSVGKLLDYFESNCSDDEDYLMQYTGLKDKNGVEIYEGDIVESDTGTRSFKASELIATIEYQIHSYYAGFCPDHHMNASCYWEVIGNIHETPNLLKG